MMKISENDIIGALAHRTKGLFKVRKALYAAATIHATTVAVLLLGLAILLHSVYV